MSQRIPPESCWSRSKPMFAATCLCAKSIDFAVAHFSSSRIMAWLMLPFLWVNIAVAETYQSSQDLKYGEALYAFYQDQYFEALTRLQVAKEKGGIQGHGDHPQLLEGGLMLSFGMTRAAQSHFEGILDDVSDEVVSQPIRNQAWFYLAKVYYLEADYTAAQEAAGKVDADLLQESDDALYQEWKYLTGQLLLKQESADHEMVDQALMSLVESYPADSLWPVYLGYNSALGLLKFDGQVAVATDRLEKILVDIAPLTAQKNGRKEIKSLEDRIRLTLAQLYLQYEEFETAASQLQQIRLNGPFADEALVLFATANAHLDRHADALKALETLSSKTLFSPWLEQVPYARGYLFEQMGKKIAAAEAYRDASDHYDNEIKQLLIRRSEMTEQTLTEELELMRESGFEASVLQENDLLRDSFGRLNTRPKNFSLMEIFATERFQIALKELNELYVLRDSLSKWNQQLESFDLMLATRAQQRQAKLKGVSAALEAQNAEHWQALSQAYGQAIAEALNGDDERFFMNEEQIDIDFQIQKAMNTLSQLPEDEDNEEYRLKLERSRALLDWWVADSYGVNRWHAQKAYVELDTAMAEFTQRNEYLQAALADSNFQSDLEGRVAKGRVRLESIRQQIDRTLMQTRQSVMAMVDDQFKRQEQSLKSYRLASHRAKTRLEDELYRRSLALETSLDESSDQNQASEGVTSQETQSTNGDAPIESAEAEEASIQ